MKTKLSPRFWCAVTLFSLIGQVAWVVENMYFNVFIYKMFNATANDIALMVGASAVAATVTTVFMGALSDRIGKRKLFICGGYILWGISIFSFVLIKADLVGKLFPTVTAITSLCVTLVIIMDCVMTFFGSTANDAAFNAWLTDSTDKTNRGAVEGINAMMPLVAILVVFGGFMFFDLEKAQRGIIVFDEFDKIAYSRSGGLEMKKAVQQQLLDFLGGGKYNIRVGNSIFDMNEVEFDTSKLTFVCLGALTDLRSKKTEIKQTIGFGQTTQSSEEQYYSITPQDLMSIGLERELVGRFNTYLHTDDYSKESLKKILKESTISPLIGFKKWIESRGKQLVIGDDVYDLIAAGCLTPPYAADGKSGRRMSRGRFSLKGKKSEMLSCLLCYMVPRSRPASSHSGCLAILAFC